MGQLLQVNSAQLLARNSYCTRYNERSPKSPFLFKPAKNNSRQKAKCKT